MSLYISKHSAKQMLSVLRLTFGVLQLQSWAVCNAFVKGMVVVEWVNQYLKVNLYTVVELKRPKQSILFFFLARIATGLK